VGGRRVAAESGRPPEFFVSYAHSDRRWAEWIGWTLEAAGHPMTIQAWDFAAGSHFVSEMHKALRGTTRTIAVVSQAYQVSIYATQEWQAAWAADPDGRARRLLVVRVEDCVPDGLLRQIVAVDVFGVDQETARERLLGMVMPDSLKPLGEPGFPGRQVMARPEPPIPRPAAVWEVPWPRNPNFVGRADELALLRNLFTGGGSKAATVLPVTVHGLGGTGKTQLAVEYAYRHAVDYDLVWWLTAGQPALVTAQLADLARRGDIAGTTRHSARAAVEELRLGRRARRWLVIADNAAVVSDLSGLLSAAGGEGHLLITSRNHEWAEVSRLVEVDVLPRAEAITLLRARAPAVPAAGAEHIAAALGDLPLALEQAGAWLAASGMSSTDYLHAVRHRTREILAEGKPPAYPAPVAATWTLAVDTLDDRLAVWLLCFWARLGPEPIPYDLLTARTVSGLPPPIAELGDPVRRGRVISAITKLGLVRHTEAGVVMHRLVQAVLRDYTPGRVTDPDGRHGGSTSQGAAAEADGADLPAVAATILRAASPGDPFELRTWTSWDSLKPHIRAVTTSDDDRPQRDADSRWLLDRLSMLSDAQHALDTLKPEYRACVILSDIEKLSVEEIAAVLGISAKVVTRRTQKGREALRAAPRMRSTQN
jgi:hypothetical protein